MIQLMISGPSSGSGKTLVTCALLRALQRRGLRPMAFKAGPDYIDPMFHRTALGADSGNLDLFLAPPARVKRLCARGCRDHDAVLCEGAMGYYDGLGGTTDEASAWHLADTLDLPVLLVLRPGGAALSLAPLIQGFLAFRSPHHLAGLLLTDASPMLASSLGPMLERETGLPYLGLLPRLPQGQLPSRHLGLVTAEEIPDLNARLNALAEALETHADLDRLLTLADRPAPADDAPTLSVPSSLKTVDTCSAPEVAGACLSPETGCSFPPVSSSLRPGVPIGVARDEAFCFLYPESLEALREAGAELRFFSPLRDPCLPSGMQGLYLPGGYPERFARELSANRSLLASLRAAIQSGLPTVAECGGFLCLGRTLADEAGVPWPMADVLPGEARDTGRLTRFGYAWIHPRGDSLLFRRGESIPCHCFHHWDSTDNGADLSLEKPVTSRSWREGFVSPTLYAGFPHLSFAGQPQLARRFVEAARKARPLPG